MHLVFIEKQLRVTECFGANRKEISHYVGNKLIKI